MINYKQVVDKLQSLIPQDDNCKWWIIELSQHYIEGDTVILIYLRDTGNGNKYRLYHSELNECGTDKDVLECCVESLREYLDDVKYVMVGMMNGCLIMMDKM